MNDKNLEVGNAATCDGKDLPWLQATNAQDVWNEWNPTFRDVIIVDENGIAVDVYNLTIHDLAIGANYAELKSKLKAAAGE